MPTCWIIAGPNGSGKTTFAMKFLPEIAKCQEFISSELIAAGLSPFKPHTQTLTANRFYLAEVQAAAERNQDFALETTLSTNSYMRILKELKEKDWQIRLIFIALSNVAICWKRISAKLAQGSYGNVDAEVISRFHKGLHYMFYEIADIADLTHCFLNDSMEPELIFEKEGKHLDIVNKEVFMRLYSQCHA